MERAKLKSKKAADNIIELKKQINEIQEAEQFEMNQTAELKQLQKKNFDLKQLYKQALQERDDAIALLKEDKKQCQYENELFY